MSPKIEGLRETTRVNLKDMKVPPEQARIGTGKAKQDGADNDARSPVDFARANAKPAAIEASPARKHATTNEK